MVFIEFNDPVDQAQRFEAQGKGKGVRRCRGDVL